MNSNKYLMQARTSAATSIQWPAKTPFLVNPDPVIRKKLQLGLICLGAVFLVCLFLTGGPVKSWIQNQESNALRPTMESAFAHGNKAAGTWLWEHYTKEYPGLLEQEADAGDPRAMYVMGLILLKGERFAQKNGIGQGMTKQQKLDLGLDLIKTAAAAGNLDAMVALANPGNRLPR